MFPTLALKIVHVWIEYNFVHKETKDTALWQVMVQMVGWVPRFQCFNDEL